MTSHICRGASCISVISMLVLTSACDPLLDPNGAFGDPDAETTDTFPTMGPTGQPTGSSSCGDVTLYGACNQGVLSYCADGALEQIDCRGADSRVSLDCMLIDQEWGFDCAAPLGGTCALVEEEVVYACAGGDRVGCVQGASDWSCQDAVGSCDPRSFVRTCMGEVLVIHCSDAGQPLGSDCNTFGLTCRQGACFGARSGEVCNEFIDCEDGLICNAQGLCESNSSTPECQRDLECPTGQTCASGRCEPASSSAECEVDAECGTDERCIDRACQPNAAPECDRPLGFLTIHKNEDIDLFVNNGCTSVRGNVFITGAVDDLRALERLREIEGDLIIQQTTSLNMLLGLNALEHIGGELVIMNNERLVDVSALSGVTAVHDNIAIVRNPYLESMRGLDNVRLIDGIVTIRENDHLSSLTGMGSLGAPTAVEISGNPKLASLDGFAFGTNMQGILALRGNDSLVSLDALSTLREVNVLAIDRNTSLQRIALPSLTFVHGILGASLNPQLSSISFPSLRSDDARVEFTRNPMLSSCAVDAFAQQLRGTGWTGSLMNTGNDMSMECR